MGRSLLTFLSTLKMEISSEDIANLIFVRNHQTCCWQVEMWQVWWWFLGVWPCYWSSSSIFPFLAQLFTALLRHGFMLTAFRDAIIQPIPKGTKDPSLSSNYHGIALASSLSKIFEWSILLTWNYYLMNFNLALNLLHLPYYVLAC